MTTEHPATPPEIPAAAPTPPGGDTTLDEAIEAARIALSTAAMSEEHSNLSWEYRSGGEAMSIEGSTALIARTATAAAWEVFTVRHAAELEELRAALEEARAIVAGQSAEEMLASAITHARATYRAARMTTLDDDPAGEPLAAAVETALRLARARYAPEVLNARHAMEGVRSRLAGRAEGRELAAQAIEALTTAPIPSPTSFPLSFRAGWNNALVEAISAARGATPTPAGGEAETRALASRMIRDELNASPVWPYTRAQAGQFGDWIATKLGWAGLLAEPPRADLAAYVELLANAAGWCRDRDVNISAGPGHVLADVRQDLIRIMNDSLPALAAEDPNPLDGAAHSVWLHGKWRWLTQQMTTPERESFAAAVVRHSAVLEPGNPVALDDLRWWAAPPAEEPAPGCQVCGQQVTEANGEPAMTLVDSGFVEVIAMRIRNEPCGCTWISGQHPQPTEETPQP